MDYRRTTSPTNIRKQNNTNKIAVLFPLIKKHGMQKRELSRLRIRWTLFIARGRSKKLQLQLQFKVQDSYKLSIYVRNKKGKILLYILTGRKFFQVEGSPICWSTLCEPIFHTFPDKTWRSVYRINTMWARLKGNPPIWETAHLPPPRPKLTSHLGQNVGLGEG